MSNGKVVLAYSGGLDTSVCVRYLQMLNKLDVITVTVDCGQEDDFKEIEKKSKAMGAVKHVYIDAREEFARDYVAPSIKANGLYQNKYPLATALARPLIAAKAVEIANNEGATSIAHGCTGKGNDQIRFDVTMHALNPKLKIIAPIRATRCRLRILVLRDRASPVVLSVAMACGDFATHSARRAPVVNHAPPRPR